MVKSGHAKITLQLKGHLTSSCQGQYYFTVSIILLYDQATTWSIKTQDCVTHYPIKLPENYQYYSFQHALLWGNNKSKFTEMFTFFVPNLK